MLIWRHLSIGVRIFAKKEAKENRNDYQRHFQPFPNGIEERLFIIHSFLHLGGCELPHMKMKYSSLAPIRRTTKLTGGDGAQRNPRPVQRLVRQSLLPFEWGFLGAVVLVVILRVIHREVDDAFYDPENRWNVGPAEEDVEDAPSPATMVELMHPDASDQ